MIPKLHTQELINELLSVTESPCVSLYMFTHRSHPENAQDPIRYKNLLKQVNESLVAKYSSAEIHKVLEPFETLVSDTEFWNHTSDGLAVFGSSNSFEAIGLQIPVKELAIVADHFHVKPLRHSLQSTDRYQVLALTMDAARLFEGNRHSLVEIKISNDLPITITQALGEELTEKHSTVASYGGVGGGSASMHHGQGGKKDEVDSDAERFFRVIATVMYDNYSKPSGLPLILAALPEHHHLFQQVNKNPLLLPKGIEINPQSISIEKLNEMAWEVIEPEYLVKLEQLADRFKQSLAHNKGSDTVEEVAQAAASGKVDTLLIEENKIMAGQLEKNDTGIITDGDSNNPATGDLLDDLGELVIKQGGKVIVLPIENMPTDTGVAAIYRY